MKFVMKHVVIIKTLLILVFAVVALFVDLSNRFSHWSWITYCVVLLMIVVLEIIQYRQQNIAPEQRVRQYFLDFDGWKRTEDIEHYVADPQFTVCPVESDIPLAFQQEWTRGEVGYHYDQGNAAYYLGVFYGDTLLHKVHIVVFDGGKKIVVAPDWQAIGNGRIYYYLADSFEFAYQRFLVRERGSDYSKCIRQPNGSGSFDIPIFRDKVELERFLSKLGSEAVGSTSDEGEQNRLFFENLEKYRCFKEGWAV